MSKSTCDGGNELRQRSDKYSNKKKWSFYMIISKKTKRNYLIYRKLSSTLDSMGAHCIEMNLQLQIPLDAETI
jgi:hypothetical protein